MMKYNINFSEFVEYDETPSTFLRWKNRCRSSFKTDLAFKQFIGKYAGAEAGYIAINNLGYKSLCVRINKKAYVISRILYTIFYGEIPEGYEVDHKDGNSLNNNLMNLRLATKSQNGSNIGITKRNISGVKGVRYNGYGWTAEIGGKNKEHLGTFSSIKEAEHAIKIKHQNLFGEFANI